jgi:hypothetical protein
LFKGGKEPGPDFLEAGDRILSGLELGSRFTWDLAHLDLLDGDSTTYGPTKRTPYVFVFIGTSDYGWLKRTVTEPGTDGTVRWSGCSLNSRKITIDLTRDPARESGVKRVAVGPWSNTDMPLVLVEGINHGTILSRPSEELIELVDSALQVSSQRDFQSYCDRSSVVSAKSKAARWQQFVIRVVDERNDPVSDYFLDFYTANARGKERVIEEITLDVHTYRDDPSFRCFHVNLDALKPERLTSLFMRVRASSGTEFVTYFGYGSRGSPAVTDAAARDTQWDAEIDLTDVLRATPDAKAQTASFFYPYKTNLVEVRVNREPLPLDGLARLFHLKAASQLWADLMTDIKPG